MDILLMDKVDPKLSMSSASAKVLLPEFTLLDCTMVFDSNEDLTHFAGCFSFYDWSINRLSLKCLMNSATTV